MDFTQHATQPVDGLSLSPQRSRPAKRGSSGGHRSRVGLALLVSLSCLLFGVSNTASAAPKKGAKAAEFRGKGLDGSAVSLEALRKKHAVVLVDFWASWCEPCQEELPFLAQMQKKYGPKGLIVVAVNVDSKASSMKKLLPKIKGSGAIVVHDEGKKIVGAYKPGTMPTSFLVNKRGSIDYVHEGFRPGDAKGFEAKIRAALGL